MRDVLVVLIVAGFFAVAAAYVRGCSAVVGATTLEEVAGNGHADEMEATA